MEKGNVTDYLSQDETIYATWQEKDTQYAATDRRIGMLRDNDFRDLPYSEVKAVRTTSRTVEAEFDGIRGLIEIMVGIGAGVVGAFFAFALVHSLLTVQLGRAIVMLPFAGLFLWAGSEGYQGWKQRNRETRDQPFVVFELDQVTKVDVDAYFGTAEVDTEKREMEIPVPDKSTMKTVTSNVR